MNKKRQEKMLGREHSKNNANKHEQLNCS